MLQNSISSYLEWLVRYRWIMKYDWLIKDFRFLVDLLAQLLLKYRIPQTDTLFSNTFPTQSIVAGYKVGLTNRHEGVSSEQSLLSRSVQRTTKIHSHVAFYSFFDIKWAIKGTNKWQLRTIVTAMHHDLCQQIFEETNRFLARRVSKIWTARPPCGFEFSSADGRRSATKSWMIRKI